MSLENGQLEGLDFSGDQTQNLMAMSNLVQQMAMMYARGRGYSQVNPIPNLGSWLPSLDAARQFYQITPYTYSAQNALIRQAVGQLGLPGNLAGNPLMTVAAGMGLSTPAGKAIFGTDVMKMAELTMRSRGAFNMYGANGAGTPIASVYNPDHIANAARQSLSFSSSLLAQFQQNGARNAELLGRFRGEEAQQLLAPAVSNVNSGIVRYREGKASADPAVVKRWMDMYNSIAEVMDTSDVEALQKVVSKFGSLSYGNLNPEQLKTTFDKIGHLAKTLDISSRAMVSNVVAVQDTIRNTSGVDISLGGAYGIVERGLASAEAMGIKDPEARSRIVSDRLRINAAARMSTGANVYTALMTMRGSMTSEQLRNLANPDFVSNANNLDRMLRSMVGDTATERIKHDAALARSNFAGLTPAEQEQTDRAIDQAATTQLRRNAVTTLANETVGIGNQLERLLPGYNSETARRDSARARVEALRGNTLIFGTDAAEDRYHKESLLDFYNTQVSRGMSPEAAIDATDRIIRSDNVLSAGYKSYVRASGLIRAHDTLSTVTKDPRAAVIGGMLAASGVAGSVDVGSVRNMLARGNMTQAEAYMRGRLGEKSYTDLYANASAEIASKTKVLGGKLGAMDAIGANPQSEEQITRGMAVVALDRRLQEFAEYKGKYGELVDPGVLTELQAKFTAAYGSEKGATAFNAIAGIDERGNVVSAPAEDVARRAAAFRERIKPDVSVMENIYGANNTAAAAQGMTGVATSVAMQGTLWQGEYQSMAGKEFALQDEARKSNPVSMPGDRLNKFISTVLKTGDIEGAVLDIAGIAASGKPEGAQKGDWEKRRKALHDDKQVQALFKHIRTNRGDDRIVAQDWKKLQDNATFRQVMEPAQPEDRNSAAGNGGGSGSGSGNMGPGEMVITGTLILKQGNKAELLDGRIRKTRSDS